jgi:Protein of unknown function (DUF1116)
VNRDSDFGRRLPDHVVPIVVGPEQFAGSLRAQGAHAIQVSYHPPLAVGALKKLYEDDDALAIVARANKEALEKITSARCRVVDVAPAGQAVPGLDRGTLLHAGPPLDWAAAPGPMRGALVGAVLYEGWAFDPDSAERMLSHGEILLSPCHEYGAVGPMAGVTSPSMPVFVVVNETFGNRAFSTINEGLGRVLRYGANDQSVLDHLQWLAESAAPLLKEAIRQAEGLDLTSIIAQALHMGDELHNRNKAATALFTRQIAGDVVCGMDSLGLAQDEAAAVFQYLAATDVFFLNLAMAACKAALDPAAGVPHSTVVTTMARNGAELGIKMSGTGNRWFTSPAPKVEGLFFPGYGPDDANPDIGDSAITETGGLGGFALAAAPGIVQFVGGSVSRGREITEEMYDITVGEHPIYQIPALDFRGTPIGIDALLVCRTGIAPVLDTGIAHKKPGIGQIGAGIVRVPLEPFSDAMEALVAAAF